MAKLKPFLIAGSDAGLETNKKSYLLPDKAFPILENAYVWRDRLKKREGLDLLGRLRRDLASQVLSSTTTVGATTNIADLFSDMSITGENAEVVPGSLVVTIAGADAATYTDDGDGTFTVTGKGVDAGSFVNYVTGEVNLVFSPVAVGGVAISVDVNYYPSLPAMGIVQRERANTNFEQTLVWDTKYCYFFDGTNYSEYLPVSATTWNGSDSQFFSGANFVGSDSSIRQLFVTNFNRDGSGNPMRYTDGSTWTDFEPSISSTQVNNESLGTNPVGASPFIGSLSNTPVTRGTVTITITGNSPDPIVIFTDPDKDGTLKGSANTNSGTIDYDTGAVSLTIDPLMSTAGSAATVFVDYKHDANTLFSARQLIPFYGRLLAFDTLEGATRGTATRFFSRLRFSQVGDPTQSSAWDSSIFGRGGFIDAPTSEEFVSAKFFKNILIVFFERTTWQLRYVGDYGMPFAFDRISSDFGSESQFSSVLFDDGVLAVGDKAIIASNSQGTERIDLKIPDEVFRFRNANEGTTRIHGIRDFQKELVYWNYNDPNTGDSDQKFPNKTLLYNYRNDTWGIFRNNITVFGQYHAIKGVTWNRTDVFWNNNDVTWDDPDAQTEFPLTICGNQEGYIHTYGYNSADEESLSITAVDRSVSPVRIEMKNHNLANNEIIYVEGLDFLDTSDSSDVTTDLNDQTYQVQFLEPYDADIVEIFRWNTVDQNYEGNFSYTPVSGTGTYIGGGKATLLPKMDIRTKDFNPFLMEGKQSKMGYIDFLTETTNAGVVSINLFTDTTVKEEGNLLVGQKTVQTQNSPLFNSPDTDITWNRFFATVFGQFISLQITYNDDQMNDRSVLDQEFVLHAMILWVKAGGRLS